MNHYRSFLLPVIFLLVFFAGCRKDDGAIRSTSKQVIYPDPDPGVIQGFFLLNEGNMGTNKATLDYFDYQTGVYTKNIYAERNPDIVKELGDVGTDIQIYGDRLYAVINYSHLVEVMDVRTARHIGGVSIPNCRYIAFKDGYAYVTSYAGPVQIDNARLGYVAKVDTATLKVVAECVVGYQPDGMAIAGNKLYVANSGGYLAQDYDNTVSVIDLDTFTETRKIEVGINLHRLVLDRYGNLWVSSRGDSYNVPSKTFVIDTQTDQLTDTFHLLPNTNMTRSGDSLYVFSADWSYITDRYAINYAIVDTREKKVVERQFIRDGTDADIKIPYGLAVHPETKELFITDASDYVTPGYLHCYSPQGIHKWTVTTGDIPAHIVFTSERLKPIE